MKRKAGKKCKTCLWWWDLYDTGERKCYRVESPFFHQVCTDGCEKYEYQLNRRMNTKCGMAFCKSK